MSRRPSLVILGDSLTAGYGLRPAEALPVRLEAHLVRLGRLVTVTGVGVSGDTMADGLWRLERVTTLRPDLCLVALGANDMLRQRPPARTRADLDAILATLGREAIPSLVCGMRAPPWLGGYAFAFDRLFSEAARAGGAAFYPFLLEGVALDPCYSLPDRLHPNAAGVSVFRPRY